MELLDKIPDTTNNWQKIPKTQCWQPVPTLALAGSLWKSIAGYCWNNNHSNRSCKYLWESKAALLWQPKLISRRHSCFWSFIPLCFTSKDIYSLICKCMPFSTSISGRRVRKLSNILRLVPGGNIHVHFINQHQNHRILPVLTNYYIRVCITFLPVSSFCINDFMLKVNLNAAIAYIRVKFRKCTFYAWAEGEHWSRPKRIKK